METMSVSGLSLFFEAEEQETAELIFQACDKSVRLIRERWDLDTPEDCRLYVMTSWLRFIFQSAPWHWQIVLGVTMPLWYLRTRRLWEYAGGWTQRFGKRRVIGIKPARLVEIADKSMGERIFVEEIDMRQKLKQITCHELTHAFTAHLKLPMWLNEGLAMLAVDEFSERQTVKDETIQLLKDRSYASRPGRYRNLSVQRQDEMVYHSVRGYWLSRYIEATRPGLMKDILSKRYGHLALEGEVAAAYGMDYEEFWTNIDGMLISHFVGKNAPTDMGLK
jgi:hypothetical protein